MMITNDQVAVRKEAIKRHDVDSSIFQGDYEDFNHGRYTNAFIYGRYQIFEEIDKVLQTLPPGARILDLGCGTGHFSNYMKGRGFEVIGLDPSEKMLGFARKNFPDISFVEGISAQLPFDSESFDCVVCIEVLRYLHPNDVVATYKEVYRTLAKDGIFFTTHVNKYATDAYIFLYFLKRLLHKIKGKTYHNCYFTTGKKEIKLLKNAGFSKVSSIGRMYASIRIGYKILKPLGILWAKCLHVFNKRESFTSNPSKALAGHLIIVATK